MNWRSYGNWFGYPKCCIDHFCSGEIITEEQYKASSYTGFIPCQKHAVEIQEGKTKLKDLIKNRKCPVSFPGDLYSEKPYTKYFLHPVWKANFKTKCSVARLHGCDLSLKMRSRR